ncbi:hypothetical protein [Acaryochloris marina]|uniref:Uncharacterized protein n=1 Tax=Acaryochloris marina (strain MBIC 11017) TaxID=329726 RepID=A8ZL56_ACAM1|nr:hypothetical protein [Acaryochloris marina]ABW31883.1 hypothetical protein AM1_B0160 [Acaryochloris marina MBIC11017]BDM82948.1 hypothetical protein AM10699_58090 [Acaryochloris marina MBIC10699]
MRPPTSVWQGYSGYWQSAFIREYLLPIGHAAWQGYLTQWRGLVSCDVDVVDVSTLDWHIDLVEYGIQYIPKAEIQDYLEVHNLDMDFVHRLMEAAMTYQPGQDILVAILGNGQVDINWLQNLAISPPDCYHEMRSRHSEFALAPSSGGRCKDGC